MKTLEDLRKAQRTTDIKEVSRHIEDDMRDAKPGSSMFDTILELFGNRVKPQNPFERIAEKPKK